MDIHRPNPDYSRRAVRPRDAELDSAGEVERLKEITARAQADLAAAKQRFQRQATEAEIKVTAQLVLELVPVIDNFERSLIAGGVRLDQPPGDDHLLAGVRLIYKQLLYVLGTFGVDAFDPSHEAFDPQLHEAVGVKHSDEHPPGVVLETWAMGYRIGDKVLRPAQVLVSKA